MLIGIRHSGVLLSVLSQMAKKSDTDSLISPIIVMIIQLLMIDNSFYLSNKVSSLKGVGDYI